MIGGVFSVVDGASVTAPAMLRRKQFPLLIPELMRLMLNTHHPAARLGQCVVTSWNPQSKDHFRPC